MKKEIGRTSRRDFLKGLAIGAGGYALGSSLIHPREAMGQSIEANLEKASLEKRWGFASGGLVHFQVSWAKMILDTRGKEKLIEEMKIRSPQFAGGDKKFVESLGLTASDARSAASMIPTAITIAYGPRQKYEIQEATPEKARVKCLECAFWNNVQAKKITDDLCSFHSRLYWDSFAKAINPNLKSTMLKAKPLGDPVCEWLLELKA
jgi:hypothetical protein